MPWALQPSPSEQARRFAEKLNCTTTDTKLMVSCLKSLPAQEVISGHFETMDPLRETISVFVPTIEMNIHDGKTFLAESPEKLIDSGNFAKVPAISGINFHEGLLNSAGKCMKVKILEIISGQHIFFVSLPSSHLSE